jgi:hypothetical protein
VVEGSCVRADCPDAGSGATGGLTAGQSGCTLTANATVSVGQAAPAAGPPASLPDTGAGNGGDGDGGGWLAWAFLAAGGAALLAAMALRFRRNSSR